MANKKNSWVRRSLKKIGKSYKEVPTAIKEMRASTESYKKARGLQKKLLSYYRGIYPSYTVIGEKQHKERMKQIEGMLEKGQYKQTRDFVQAKIEEFNRLNYKKEPGYGYSRKMLK